MCPMCEDTCEPWTLSDSCVYAKVSVPVRLTYKLQSLLLWVCRCQGHTLNCHSNNCFWNMIILNGYAWLSRQTIVMVNDVTVTDVQFRSPWLFKAKKCLKRAKFWANPVQLIFQRSEFSTFVWGNWWLSWQKYSHPSKLSYQQMVSCSF